MLCPACCWVAPSVPGLHRTQGGRIPPRPGGSGDQFYYRGYALQWVEVPNSWDLEVSDESGLAWNLVTGQTTWLATGTEGQFRFGNDPIMDAAKIQRSSGRYGGQGIDEIIYKEIGGVEIQITGTELQN